MALHHTQCPASTPGSYVRQSDGHLKCTACGRVLIPDMDLPARMTGEIESADELSLDPAFDRIASLVSKVLGVPWALVTLIDTSYQVFLGVSESWTGGRYGPLSESFCQYVVLSASPLIIPDADAEPLVADELEQVRAGGGEVVVAAYMGMPVRDSDGLVVGSLCLIDEKPREWSKEEMDLLNEFAAVVTDGIQKRNALAMIKNVVVRAEARNAERLTPN
jgi:GAF domain-containing protein